MKSSTHLSVICVFLFLVFSVLSSFDSQKKNIKLIDATSQKSNSGVKGGINSTEYYFKIKILTSEKINFDSLWIGTKVFNPFIANNKTVVSSQGQSPTYSKNDTITLRISDLQSGKSSSVSNPPIKYNGSALLRYKIKGGSHFLVIKKIKSVQAINRP